LGKILGHLNIDGDAVPENYAVDEKHDSKSDDEIAEARWGDETWEDYDPEEEEELGYEDTSTEGKPVVVL
jgi:hypothetical protein